MSLHAHVGAIASAHDDQGVLGPGSRCCQAIVERAGRKERLHMVDEDLALDGTISIARATYARTKKREAVTFNAS